MVTKEPDNPSRALDDSPVGFLSGTPPLHYDAGPPCLPGAGRAVRPPPVGGGGDKWVFSKLIGKRFYFVANISGWPPEQKPHSSKHTNEHSLQETL